MNEELSREQLLDIAKEPEAAEGCSECFSLSCPGWISKPGYFDVSKLRIVGTLRIEGAQESWDEYHPDGTNFWSEDAPISIQHHPYNRSDILECGGCKKKFLHYTEYGGYYLDERIRELSAHFIV